MDSINTYKFEDQELKKQAPAMKIATKQSLLRLEWTLQNVPEVDVQLKPGKRKKLQKLPENYKTLKSLFKLQWFMCCPRKTTSCDNLLTPISKSIKNLIRTIGIISTLLTFLLNLRGRRVRSPVTKLIRLNNASVNASSKWTSQPIHAKA